MKFSKGDIQAVLAAASKDSSRYNLNGVFVEPGSMVTTDGHRLHRITGTPEESNADDAPDGFILSRDSADQFAKSMTAKTTAEPVAPSIERAGTFETSDGQQYRGEVIDGEFPNYSQVIPKGEPVHTVRLNARYLKELCAAVIQAEKNLEVENTRGVMIRETFVDIEFREDLAPVRFVGAAGRFDGVIMPVRK